MFTIGASDKIAVIGLGYVGLPLAAEFGKGSPTIGFDIHEERIRELQSGFDRTLEVSKEEIAESSQLSYTCNAEDLADCKVFIVTVPTPINRHKQPDLTPLVKSLTNIFTQMINFINFSVCI